MKLYKLIDGGYPELLRQAQTLHSRPTVGPCSLRKTASLEIQKSLCATLFLYHFPYTTFTSDRSSRNRGLDLLVSFVYSVLHRHFISEATLLDIFLVHSPTTSIPLTFQLPRLFHTGANWPVLTPLSYSILLPTGCFIWALTLVSHSDQLLRLNIQGRADRLHPRFVPSQPGG